MNKRMRSLLLAGLLAASLCGNAIAATVSPSKDQITVSKYADTVSFSIYVTADAAYAGADFALCTSSSALQFDSILYENGLHHTQHTVKDDVLYFGYFTDANTIAPEKHRVATITYQYTNSADCEINLLDAQVFTIAEDGKTVLSKDANNLFTVDISRKSTSSSRPSVGGGTNTSKPEADKPEEEPEAEKPEEDANKKPVVFTDTTNHWAKNAIAEVVERGLFNGMSDSTFVPEAAITRGMFVTVLGRIAQVTHQGDTNFADVPADAYYANYVAWAYENGIVNGMSETAFAPNAPITREQMAVMLANYAEFSQTTLTESQIATDFADEHTISNWANEAVRMLQTSGVLNGRETGAFDPMATATRAEAATVFVRFINLL